MIKIFLPTILLIILIFFFITVIVRKRKRKNKKILDLATKFLVYRMEVSNPNIKEDIFRYAMDTLDEKNEIDDVEKYFIDRFGDHIPSLISEKREEKINKILDNGIDMSKL